MAKINIEYTRTARHSLADIVSHLEWCQQASAPVVNEILSEFEERIMTFPKGCPVSPTLLKIGVSRYRECNTANGYRVLYSVNNDTVTVHLFLAQRQDVQQLLFKRLIDG